MAQRSDTLDKGLASAGQKAMGDRRTRSSAGFWLSSWRTFRRDKLAMAALVVALLIILFTLAAPLVSMVTGFTYRENDLANRLAPVGTGDFILGADGNGRDILTRLAYGGRISLLFAATGALSTLVLGILFGAISGYFGGWVDTLIMRVVDIILSLPTLVVLILISSFYQPSVIVLALVIGVVSWPGVARLVRAQVLSLRGRDFVEAARVIGANDRIVILRHILPNIVPIVVVWLSLAVPGYILTETTLSYLGVGVRTPTPSWGNMLQESQAVFRQSWTVVFIPGFMVFLTALCMSLVGNGIRDAVDPRLKNN
ncbi:MAG TPA: ABC transporter permease [Thermomicrobiales bacterium]|jgi:peptide/nickel transport system permease protein|nr:ABC transporter permease [Thermomicrobiales bacterium]